MCSSILNVIFHYQQSIEKSINDEERLRYCIDKLYKLPIKVEHLQTTGIGKTVNSLRKCKSDVGVAARALVAKWKAMVVNEDKSNKNSEEDVNDCRDTKSKHHHRSPAKKSEGEKQENNCHLANNYKNEKEKRKKKSYEMPEKALTYQENKDTMLQLSHKKHNQELNDSQNQKSTDDEEEFGKLKKNNSKNTKHRENEEYSKQKHKISVEQQPDNENENKYQKSKTCVGNNKHSNEHSHTKDSYSDKKERKRKTSTSAVQNKVPKVVEDGIDSTMGTSFEEALGIISHPINQKNPVKKSPKRNGFEFKSSTPSLLKSKVNLEPLDPNIALELPVISPNYKPMLLNPMVMDCVFSNDRPERRQITDEEAFGAGISSKTVRTKVYSGVRPGAIIQVPTLFDLCVRILQKNIDALEYTGGVPFEVLKPVIERANPQQLLIFEDYNPYIMEESDLLWKQHCMRHYRTQKRKEMETWREMFLRCKEEQEERLNFLAENIKRSQKEITLPIRKTQLAYVDSAVKPPRNILRKQEQHGTSSQFAIRPIARSSNFKNIELRGASESSANYMRPRKAPLMAKTLQLMKGRFKR